MANPTAQQCHAMTTYYVNAYDSVVGKKPVVNRNTAKAGWNGLLMDYTPTEAKAMVDYYLAHYDEPNLVWFLYNYDKVLEHKNERERVAKQLEARRVETEKCLEEWRNRWSQKS